MRVEDRVAGRGVLVLFCGMLVTACGGSGSEPAATSTTPPSVDTTVAPTTTDVLETTTTEPDTGCDLVDGRIVIDEADWGTIDPAYERFAPLGLTPEETETVVCDAYQAVSSGEDPFSVMRSLVDDFGYESVVSEVNSNGNLFFHPVPGEECDSVFAVLAIGSEIDFALYGPEPDGYFNLVGGACDGVPEAGTGVATLSMDFGGDHLELEIFECPVATIEAGEFWHAGNGRQIATHTDGTEWQVSASFNGSEPGDFSFEAIEPSGPYFVASSQSTTMESQFEGMAATFVTTFHDQVYQGEPDTEVTITLECESP